MCLGMMFSVVLYVGDVHLHVVYTFTTVYSMFHPPMVPNASQPQVVHHALLRCTYRYSYASCTPHPLMAHDMKLQNLLLPQRQVKRSAP